MPTSASDPLVVGIPAPGVGGLSRGRLRSLLTWAGTGAGADPLAGVPGPVLAAVVGVAYLALAQYVVWLNDPVHAGAGYWPAAGLTVATLVLLPERRWGWVIAAIVVAEIGGDSLHGYPLAASGWWAAGNVAEPMTAALLLRRVGTGGRLAPVGNLAWFLVAAVVLAPLVGATLGSVGTATVWDRSRLDVLLKWWAGDGLGVLVVAPLLLSLRERPVPGRSRLETGALAVALIGVSAFAFRNWHPEWDVVVPYLVFPLLMWASVRFGIRGAALAGFAVAEIANLATALGYGPFQLAAGPDGHAVTVLQVFLAAALTSALVMATLVNHTLARTRQYERQRSVADALQAAVLPERLPAVPGLVLAARYAPAAEDAAIHVGGDWYDAFPLPDGSTALVTGDVAGHDLSAAVVMGRLRNGLRSLLMELRDPALVLGALDRQLEGGDDGALATAVIAVADNGELRWASAGHPPLLLVPATGPARYLESEPGPMLGVGAGGYVTHRAPLARGDLVVGFTDGLIEHRSWSLDEALAHLARVAARAPRHRPNAFCEELLAKGLGGRSRDDDACILVARRTA